MAALTRRGPLCSMATENGAHPSVRAMAATPWLGANFWSRTGGPRMGSLIITAIQTRDYFLLQGIFLFIIVGVLVANFIVDILYVIVDPRTRVGLQGS